MSQNVPAPKPEQIATDLYGRLVIGHRIVQGTQSLRQVVQYGERTKADIYSYRPMDAEYMLGVARVILREMVREERRRPKAPH